MKHFLFALALAALLSSGRAAPFQNLGFDDGQTNATTVQNSFGTTADLLPDWQIYSGSTLVSVMGFDQHISLEVGTVATLFDSNETYGGDVSLFPQGKFGLLLQGNTQNGIPVSLVQRGDIPVGATFLQFVNQGDTMSLELNGVQISRANPQGSGSQPFLEAFDVSAFAGQNVELRLITDVHIPLAPQDDRLLDSIKFVPEPSAAILLIFAGAGLGFALWRRRPARCCW